MLTLCCHLKFTMLFCNENSDKYIVIFLRVKSQNHVRESALNVVYTFNIILMGQPAVEFSFISLHVQGCSIDHTLTNNV